MKPPPTANEPSQRLNVDISKSQYFALKSYALHHDTTVSQLVRDAVQDIVDYDQWFRQRVQVALDDPRPPVAPEQWSKVRREKLTERKRLLGK